jgi:hypothetical protein
VAESGAIYERDLDDGRTVYVFQMIYTWRLAVGPTGEQFLDDGYCYPMKDLGLVIEAAVQ